VSKNKKRVNKKLEKSRRAKKEVKARQTKVGSIVRKLVVVEKK
jgi:hypothetical protein